jgi:hypothetical protein
VDHLFHGIHGGPDGKPMRHYRWHKVGSAESLVNVSPWLVLSAAVEHSKTVLHNNGWVVEKEA